MDLLKEELRQSLVLSGCANIDDVRYANNLVVHESFYQKSKI
jgi:isopentenyl diphosphate isomerase/L-lactate dehydrogenase-like FMN-dependent dehydrogenase